MRGVGINRRIGYAVSYSVPLLTVGTDCLPGQGVAPAGEAIVRIFPRDFAIPVIYALHPNCRTPLKSKQNAPFATAEFLVEEASQHPQRKCLDGRWRVSCQDCHHVPWHRRIEVATFRISRSSTRVEPKVDGSCRLKGPGSMGNCHTAKANLLPVGRSHGVRFSYGATTFIKT